MGRLKEKETEPGEKEKPARLGVKSSQDNTSESSWERREGGRGRQGGGGLNDKKQNKTAWATGGELPKRSGG